MKLRWYQQKYQDNAFAAWESGIKNYAAVSPTGSGKTPLIASVIQRADVATVAYAHRKELVCQMSLTLAKFDIPHRIIGSQSTVRDAVKLHLKYLRASAYDPGSNIAVASVDTVNAQVKKHKHVRDFLSRAELLVVDECHHVLRDNKWGKALGGSPGAYGLFVTATLERGDGKGLGRCSDGVIDTYDELISLGDCISAGYLTPFEIMVPENGFDRSELEIAASGDYSKKSQLTAMSKKPIVGDVVRTYLDRCPGKRNIVFAVSVEEARNYEAAFKKQNVAAEVIEGAMGDLDRYVLMDKFRDGHVLNLISVDLIGEGVDVPAVDSISMARPTKSYRIMTQQIGRPLRLHDGKLLAYINDHVGNIPDLGLSCLSTGRATLAPRCVGKEVDDSDPVVTCVNPECRRAYFSTHPRCPYCGEKEYKNHRAPSSKPKEVDGDLVLYTDEHLDKLRQKINKALNPEPRLNEHLSHAARLGFQKNHRVRRKALLKLRDAIAKWLGCMQYYESCSRRQSWRKFYKYWAVDVLTAQTQTGPAMDAMAERIISDIQRIEEAGKNVGI